MQCQPKQKRQKQLKEIFYKMQLNAYKTSSIPDTLFNCNATSYERTQWLLEEFQLSVTLNLKPLTSNSMIIRRMRWHEFRARGLVDVGGQRGGLFGLEDAPQVTGRTRRRRHRGRLAARWRSGRHGRVGSAGLHLGHSNRFVSLFLRQWWDLRS